MTFHLNHRDSGKIIQAIEKVIPDWNDPCWCGKTIGELISCAVPEKDTDRTLKDICLYAYGNDLPGLVRILAGLTLIGDGECPECGSNDNIVDCDEWKCETCGHVERVIYATYN